MLKAGETTVRLHAFTFDREAIGSLALSLWKFCHERRGAISRGDVRIEVDFSAVIRPDQLDAQVERLKLR